jgi:hypothetical protein
MKHHSLSFVAGTGIATLLVVCAGHLRGAEAPKSPEQLREAASHVVTGQVVTVEVRSAYSDIEVGGFDHAIWCAIVVDAAEKGEGVRPGDKLVVRCFRPKARLALGQFASLQGHSPIPAPGQQVRAYLQKGRGYYVVHPNGFAPEQGDPLAPADEVSRLGWWSPGFTLLLPLELWGLIAVLVLPAAALALVTPRPRLRRALKLVLAVPAALWAAGLSAALLQFLATFGRGEPWMVPAVVVILGVAVVAPFAVLTVWLCSTALPGDAQAKQPGAS